MFDFLTDPLIRALRAPLHSYERIYWVYLLAALVIAFGAYRDRVSETGERQGFLRFLFPRDVWWHPSARIDYVYFLVDAVIFTVLLLPWLGSTAAGRAIGEKLAAGLVARGAADVGPAWLLPLLLAVA